MLEVEAARARRGKAGLVQIDAEGFVAAGSRHRSSRAADPQLHTHVLVANLVWSPADRRWSALDARPLYRWAKTAGYLYEAQLRAELTRRLGVDQGPVRNGIAEMAGIDRTVLDEFPAAATRSVAHLDARDCPGTGRPARRRRHPLRQGHRHHRGPVHRLAQPGRPAAFDASVIDQLCDRTAPDSSRHCPTPTSCSTTSPRRGLTAANATFDRRDVIMAISARAAVPAPTSTTSIAAAAVPPLRRGRRLPRRDGSRRTVHDRRDARHRSPALGAGRARSRRPCRLRRRGPPRRHGGPILTAEQRGMVLHTVPRGDRIEVIEGVAGAGKTNALAVASEAWESSGHHVHGVPSPPEPPGSSRTAQASRPDPAPIPRPAEEDAAMPSQQDVVVVDEAGMVGTRTLTRLAEHVEAADAKLVLIGDPRQLPGDRRRRRTRRAGGAGRDLAPP